MKLNLTQAWDDAVAMITANREVLVVVSGIFFFLPNLVMGLIVPAEQTLAQLDPEQIEQMTAAISQLYASYWWLIALVIFAQLVGYVALLALLRSDDKPTVGEAIRFGVVTLPTSIATYLLFVVGLTLVSAVFVAIASLTGVDAIAVIAVLLVFVFAIYCLVKVSLSAAAIALEKLTNPVRVLRRSWSVTKGNSLRLFGFFILLMVAYFVLSMVLGIAVLALSALLGDDIGRIVNAIVSGIAGTVATVVLVAVLASTFDQLRGPTISLSKTFD